MNTSTTSDTATRIQFNKVGSLELIGEKWGRGVNLFERDYAVLVLTDMYGVIPRCKIADEIARFFQTRVESFDDIDNGNMNKIIFIIIKKIKATLYYFHSFIERV